MSALGLVVERLVAANIPHALIGAVAFAMHGATRSTLDVALLVLDPRVLADEFWDDLRKAGVEIEIHRGDAFDTLEGVVRFSPDGPDPIDVVVGHSPRWQRGLLERAAARRVPFRGVEVPLPEPADLVLSKLYAGSRRDLRDIHELLDLPVGESIAPVVEARLGDMPARCRPMWEAIRAGR